MKVKLISIGNSKGVRIPRSVIEECGLRDRVEMRVADGGVVLSAARDTRAGWDEAFAKMAAAGDDALLVPEAMEHDWDAEEWEW